jgi:cephalosporin hydroxylase
LSEISELMKELKRRTDELGELRRKVGPRKRTKPERLQLQKLRGEVRAARTRLSELQREQRILYLEPSPIPDLGKEDSTNGAEAKEVVRRFHTLYYDSHWRTWGKTTWLGLNVLKCPLDLWIYQEIIFKTRPDVIIESGTLHGGTAYYLASICELVDRGRIITIDIDTGKIPRREHPRLTYLNGSSVAPEIVASVRESIRPSEKVMVILDSDHAKDHVLAELRTWGPMVTVGNYLIVEDTNVNGHPVLPDHGPGPMEAVEEFLTEEKRFVIDDACEKFFMTCNPRGYLRCER